ncbi:MAG: DUF3638 domain-containing protein [Verrucomicrobia bacterium]|nr:DUF3638 domain-containing protein [Verrucomicrobiota bacterium]
MNAKNLDEVRKNGLLPMLHHLAHFSSGETKQGATKLLRDLYFSADIRDEIKAGGVTGKPIEGATATPKKEKVKPEELIKKGVQSLHGLGNTKASDEEKKFLLDLGSSYFEDKKKDRPITKGTLFNTKSIEAAGDKMTEEQFRLKQDDIAIAEQGDDKLYTLKSDKELAPLLGSISDLLIRESQTLASIEEKIVQSVHLALLADPISEIQFRSKKRKAPTIQELCVLSCRLDSDAVLAKRYPELSTEAIASLKEAVKNYLIQKQFVQHLDRSKEKIEEIEAAQKSAVPKETIAILMDDLGKSLVVTRAYDMDDPLAMIFLAAEAILKFKLRADQVANIQKFDKAQKNSEDMVLQMIMGAGKTSVLQPVLAFLFARSDRLSSVCVPPSLFVEVRSKLSQVLGDSYDQLVFVMPFNRDSGKDMVYLSTYLEGLRNAKERGSAVLFTPDQRKAILAAWKESLSVGNAACNELINDIMQEFQNELLQIDEIDMVMDPGIIYKFPIGDEEIVNRERATIVSQLVMRLASDSEICKKVSLDFVNKFQSRSDPNYKKPAKELTATLYDREVAPQLSKIAFAILDETNANLFAELRKNDPNKYLEHFMLQTTPFDGQILAKVTRAEAARLARKLPATEEALSSYPEGSVEHLVIQKNIYEVERKEWIETKISDPEIRRSLAVCAKAISATFRKSLFKECGSNYHVDPQSNVYVARPYFAPGSPKPSIPSDPYEQVIYSAQLALHEGIPRRAVVDIFRRLQNSAEREMSAEGAALSDTDAYKEYARIFGEQNVSKFIFKDKPPSDALIDAFQVALNKDQKSLQGFMETYVFKQVSLFTKSISVTPQGFAGVGNQDCGYSGTIKKGIFTPTMKPQEEKGTDGRTIAKLESDFQNGNARIRAANAEKLSYTEQMKEIFATESDVYVFMDSGNLLKDKANLQEYVDEVLSDIQKVGKRPEIKGCIFPNMQTGEWLSRERGDDGKWVTIPLSQSKLKVDERVTIIPSKHETGTDIKQPPTARAIVSIRKDMKLRDILQAVFRMRQVLNAQTVDFFVTQEVQDHIATLILQAAFEKEPYKSMLGATYRDFGESIVNLKPNTEVEKAIQLMLAGLFVDQKESDWNAKGINERLDAMGDAFSKQFALNSDSIWNYLLKNYATSAREECWMAGKHKMKEIVEKPIRDVMMKLPYPERKKVYDQLQTLFEATEKDDPWESLHNSRQVSAQEGIDYEVERCKKFLALIQDSAIGKAVNERIAVRYKDGIDAALRNCVSVDDIPPVVTIGADSGGEEMEVEVEVEVEIEQEQEQEQERGIGRGLDVEVFYTGLEEKQYRQLCAVENDGYVLEGLGRSGVFVPVAIALPSEQVRSLFSQDEYALEVSPNVMLAVAEGSKIGDPWHGGYFLPGQYLLVTKSPGQKDTYRLVSCEDGAKIKSGMLNSSKIADGSSMALISFNGKISGKVPPDMALDLDDKAVQKAIVQAKLLSGKAVYKKSELALISELIGDDQPTALGLKTMLENTLRYMPESAKVYKTSPICKLLRELSGVDV